MTKLFSQASGIGALTLVLLFAPARIAAADGWPDHHRYIRHHHAAYVDVAPYGACRVGWWQTLRYAHVRPRWEAWCR